MATRSLVQTATQLETVIPNLYATPPERLPFGHRLGIRAYLLRREKGNLLIYSVTGLDRSADGIQELGGITRHYLNHRHEAGFASRWVSAPLYVHANERAAVNKAYIVHRTFTDGHMVDDDFVAIPTPGHTSGATAYLWDSGQYRVLFTGDTIYLHNGEWIAAVLKFSDRAAYMESLEHLRGLDFDVLAPWAATLDDPYYVFTDKADAQRRIDAILMRLHRGEDH